jgi:hypothetical protein
MGRYCGSRDARFMPVSPKLLRTTSLRLLRARRLKAGQLAACPNPSPKAERRTDRKRQKNSLCRAASVYKRPPTRS